MRQNIHNTKLSSFLFMHAAFLVYCLYPILGKFATRYDILSVQFIALYCVVFGYAILWQQVLKKIPLTSAIANKSITIVWGMVFGFLFFKEAVSLKMIIGAALILSGIFILSTEKENSKDSETELSDGKISE